MLVDVLVAKVSEQCTHLESFGVSTNVFVSLIRKSQNGMFRGNNLCWVSLFVAVFLCCTNMLEHFALVADLSLCLQKRVLEV